jgi:hypothetical protein
MSTTHYPSYDPTALFAGDASHTSDPITIASGTNSAGTFLLRGTILGMITANGKYIVSASAASDGSQAPHAVLAADCDSSAGDVVAPAYFTGEFTDYSCVFGAGHTQATVEASLRASNSGIFIRTVGSVA